MVQPSHPTHFQAFLDGAPFSAGDQVLDAALAFGGCLADWVSGAFFRARAGTGSSSDSEMDLDPDSESSSIDLSKSDSNFSISVDGGGSFLVGVEGVDL